MTAKRRKCVVGGTVTSHIKQYGAFGEESLKRLLVQLVDAINYLHCQNVVHRDIKGDNILLDRWGLNLKLCDFGAAAILSCNCTEPMEFANQLVGTVCFMAPEVRLQLRTNKEPFMMIAL